MFRRYFFLLSHFFHSCLQVKLAVTWVCFLAAVFLPSLSLSTSPFIFAAPVTKKSFKYPSYRGFQIKVACYGLHKRDFSYSHVARMEITSMILISYNTSVLQRRSSPNFAHCLSEISLVIFPCLMLVHTCLFQRNKPRQHRAPETDVLRNKV